MRFLSRSIPLTAPFGIQARGGTSNPGARSSDRRTRIETPPPPRSPRPRMPSARNTRRAKSRTAARTRTLPGEPRTRRPPRYPTRRAPRTRPNRTSPRRTRTRGSRPSTGPGASDTRPLSPIHTDHRGNHTPRRARSRSGWSRLWGSRPGAPAAPRRTRTITIKIPEFLKVRRAPQRALASDQVLFGPCPSSASLGPSLGGTLSCALSCASPGASPPCPRLPWLVRSLSMSPFE